jgi:hypothetical protein
MEPLRVPNYINEPTKQLKTKAFGFGFETNQPKDGQVFQAMWHPKDVGSTTGTLTGGRNRLTRNAKTNPPRTS